MPVWYTHSARKVLEALARDQPKVAAAIIAKLVRLDEYRNFAEVDVKRLKGRKTVAYRLRVGEYRVEFELGRAEVVVLVIDKRGQLYK